MTSQEEQRRADLMARVQPPQADLEWEELEEGEGEGEGVGGGEGGGEREQCEGVKGEEVEGRTDAGDKSQGMCANVYVQWILSNWDPLDRISEVS